MINVIIPMAGLGSRFVNAGYTIPKPFINVVGKPMIQRVLDNLNYPDARYILIARKEHLDAERKAVEHFQDVYNAVFISISQVTEGAACTVLFARELINNNNPVIIANSDQIIDIDFKDFADDCLIRKLDGNIMTFRDPFKDNKWSFVSMNNMGLVTEVREKIPISDIATVGIYMFSKGSYFVDAAIDMIIHNDRINGEFYVCPVYNYAIKNKQKIGIFNIEFKQMHGIGTPEDLNKYIRYLKKGNPAV